MQDAFNLSWKLALVIRGICGEQLLDSYSPERSSVGDSVLKAAGRLTEIGTLHNPVAQAIRNVVGHALLGLAPVQHALAANMSEITIGYPSSPLNGPALGKGPKPGQRVAPVVSQKPIGSGSTPQFSLIAVPTAATARLVKTFEGLVSTEILPPLAEEGIWLVRPDGYVACAAKDPEAVAEYLSGLLPK
jgi:hypothetical protein